MAFSQLCNFGPGQTGRLSVNFNGQRLQKTCETSPQDAVYPFPALSHEQTVERFNRPELRGVRAFIADPV